MSQTIQDNQLSFQPNLNFLRISQRKLRRVLGWLILGVLILFGIYGVFVLIAFREYLDIFYLSLVVDMFVIYLWQRKKEKVRSIRLEYQKAEIEISGFLDKSAQDALERAWLFCYRKGYHFLRPIHLLSAFLRDKDFKKILKRLDCRSEDVIKKTKNILNSSSFFPESERGIGVLGPKIASDFKKIFVEAYLFCLRQDKDQINSLDILWAISQQKNLVGMIFDEFGISPEEIEKTVEWAQIENQIKKSQSAFLWRRFFKPKGKLNRTMTAASTPLLDKVSQDLTFLAKKGQFEMMVGREKDIDEIFNFFSAGQVGVVLVGPGQIGKRSVLQKIAQLMVEENVPKFLKDKRLVALDLSSLVSLSGAGQGGEENLKRIIFEVSRAGNIVLVIENVDNLSGLKSQASGLDFSEILASELDNQSFFFIGTTLPEGFASKIEGKILGRVLNKVNIGLPSRDLLWRLLIAKIFPIEQKLKVFFSADALEQAIDLADRYLYGKALPAKAIGLLTEAAYLKKRRKESDKLIKGSDIVGLVTHKTNIPLGQIQEMEKDKLLNLEDLIHKRVVNQEEAVKAVAAALRRSRLDPAKREKPISNFLFVGPTGVGKTEVAKTLARAYFGDQKRMIRLDMSEYQEKRGLRRLIGSRSEQGMTKGYLTEAIKRQPYSLLLLDEIEKAHPDILNLFLQVMDDGRLTDISGGTINCSNIILIATSNAGTQFIQEQIAKGVKYEETEKELKERVLLEYFRPEFLNRFDKIVLFKALSMGNMITITYLFLGAVNQKLEQRGVVLETEEAAVEELAQLGFDPLYGARPLRRVIQEKIENVLARMFLEDRIKRRDKVLLKRGLVFEIKKAPEI